MFLKHCLNKLCLKYLPNSLAKQGLTCEPLSRAQTGYFLITYDNV